MYIAAFPTLSAVLDQSVCNVIQRSSSERSFIHNGFLHADWLTTDLDLSETMRDTNKESLNEKFT